MACASLRLRATPSTFKIWMRLASRRWVWWLIRRKVSRPVLRRFPRDWIRRGWIIWLTMRESPVLVRYEMRWSWLIVIVDGVRFTPKVSQRVNLIRNRLYRAGYGCEHRGGSVNIRNQLFRSDSYLSDLPSAPHEIQRNHCADWIRGWCE